MVMCGNRSYNWRSCSYWLHREIYIKLLCDEDQNGLSRSFISTIHCPNRFQFSFRYLTKSFHRNVETPTRKVDIHRVCQLSIN